MSLFIVALLGSAGVTAYLAAQKPVLKSATASEKLGSQADDKKSIFDQEIDTDARTLEPDPSEGQARDMFAKCRAIKATIVTRSGTRQKRFVFPDWPIGKIWADGFDQVAACGVVYVPADKVLTLEVGLGQSRQVLNSPEIVDKIDCTEVGVLIIEGRMPSDLSHQINGRQSQINGLIHILRAAGKWSNLKRLRLDHLVINEEAAVLLNGCKHLSQLVVAQPEGSLKDLANQPFLTRLNELDLRSIDRADSMAIKSLFGKLAVSQNLQTLSLLSWKIAPDSLLELRQCPKLHQLTLQDTNFDQLVPVLTRLTSLQNVTVAGAAINFWQIKSITACPNIRCLALSQRSLSPEVIKRCGTNQPKVVLLQ